jgi:hypothetical protein
MGKVPMVTIDCCHIAALRKVVDDSLHESNMNATALNYELKLG